MSRHVEPRASETPGPRTRITLDVSELSLPVLVEGIDAARCWLEAEGDGVYRFCATQTLGQSREQPGEPAIDILQRLVNEFADRLDGEDVPQHLRDAWAEMVDSYVAQTGKPHDHGGPHE